VGTWVLINEDWYKGAADSSAEPTCLPEMCVGRYLGCNPKLSVYPTTELWGPNARIFTI
jgi:hypothetical protein